MSKWYITNSCKKCNKPHNVYISQSESPADDSVYAYICPETNQEMKFRWKEAAFVFEEKDGAIKAYLSKA